MAARGLQLAAVLSACALAQAVLPGPPWIIAHRGASGALPEHTLEAYRLAIEGGAHFIECDVVATKDRHLICRHEPLLSGTTDADEKFPERVTTYSIDGEDMTGVFSTDLTLAEVKSLRAVQPNDLRDPSYDGLYQVPTFEEYVAVALAAGRTVGIYPETKHPQWHDGLDIMAGTTLSDLLLEALRAKGYGGAVTSARWARQPVFIQSFEVGNLKALAAKTELPLVQLLGGWEGYVTPDTGATHSEMTTPAALREIATYAAGVGPWKDTIRPTTDEGYIGPSTGLVQQIQAAGMQVHPYTFRNEATPYLGWTWAQDPWAELHAFFAAEGVEGVFTDFPASGAQFLARQALGSTSTLEPDVEPYNPLKLCDGKCARTFGKCGGRGVDGAKQCCDAHVPCVRKNSFYAQCRPRMRGAPSEWSGKRLTCTRKRARQALGAHEGRPLVIAHRGVLPEHTLEAYGLAILQGADFIECDVVATKDKRLICRHEPLLSGTTDADEKFPERATTYSIDGEDMTGVFSTDLTLAEVKTLRAVQPNDLRDPNYDGDFKVPTFEEYLEAALRSGKAGRPVGVYPETKHPQWHDSLDILKGTSLSDLVLDALTKYGYEGDIKSRSWAKQPAFIQSFEVGNLKALAAKTDLPLVQLLGGWKGYVTPDTGATHEEMTTPAALREIATYAAGVGPWKHAIVTIDEDANHLVDKTDLVEKIHAVGMQVHPYTFRNESPAYIAFNLTASARAEYDLFFKEMAIDGAFTDFPATLVDYLKQAELEGHEW